MAEQQHTATERMKTVLPFVCEDSPELTETTWLCVPPSPAFSFTSHRPGLWLGYLSFPSKMRQLLLLLASSQVSSES